MSPSNAAEDAVVVERTPVEGECSACGAAALMRYPVLSEGGWFDVVKCQRCLHSESREPDPVGPVAVPSAVLI